MNTNLGTWKKWTPKGNVFPKFDIEFIDNNTKGIFIKLKNNYEYSQSMIVTFCVMWFSYKVIKTKDYCRTIEILKKQKGPDFVDSWSLFEVEDSDYLRWVQEESHGVYEDYDGPKIKHYVFMGTNIIFEILMYESDELKIINKEDELLSRVQ